jgi:hypothetical protein
MWEVDTENNPGDGAGNEANEGDHFKLKKTKKRRRGVEEVVTEKDVSDISNARPMPQNETMETYQDAPDKIRDLYSSIVSAKTRVTSGDKSMLDVTDCIELQSILSKTSFLNTVEAMFCSQKSDTNKHVSIPLITREYEESYMRECFRVDDEECVMGVNCECMFIDRHFPFIGTCFWSPLFEMADSISKPLCSKLCVLCCRKNTQQMFYDLMFSHVRFNGFIQLYGNICGQPGEYAKQAALICPPNGPVACMPFPIVAHQRNRYSVLVQNGVKYIKQHNVYYEDFHKPSSSN